jgi:hypothetical protein
MRLLSQLFWLGCVRLITAGIIDSTNSAVETLFATLQDNLCETLPLKGSLSDCCCDSQTVETANAVHFYPILSKVVKRFHLFWCCNFNEATSVNFSVILKLICTRSASSGKMLVIACSVTVLWKNAHLLIFHQLGLIPKRLNRYESPSYSLNYNVFPLMLGTRLWAFRQPAIKQQYGRGTRGC